MKKAIILMFFVSIISCKNSLSKNNENSNTTIALKNTFSCKIDGKDWKSDDDAINCGFGLGLLVLNGATEKGNDYISIPIDSTQYLSSKTFHFKKHDLLGFNFQLMTYGILKPNLEIYSALEGNVTFSKSTPQIAQGTFDFIAETNETHKVVKITDGVFNVKLGHQ